MVQDIGCPKETTINEEVLHLKNKLTQLKEELETFLRYSSEEKKPTPSIPEPIAEIIANIQDCKLLISSIRQLAIDKIARRVNVFNP